MKQYIEILVMIIILSFTFSCTKDSTSIFEYINNKEYFQAVVLGKGIDCGDVFLVQFKGRFEEIEEITGEEWDIYYADKLPTKFKINNIELVIKFRNPAQDELYPCTMLGITYPHIIILDAIQK